MSTNHCKCIENLIHKNVDWTCPTASFKCISTVYPLTLRDLRVGQSALRIGLKLSQHLSRSYAVSRLTEQLGIVASLAGIFGR